MNALRHMLILSIILFGFATDVLASCCKNIEEVVRGNNQFACDLYRQLRSEDGNLFFSPYSISTAIALAYAGADGQTEQQIAETMHFASGEEFHENFGRLEKTLNDKCKADLYQLSIANALWGQKDYKFRKTYLDRIKQNYSGEIRYVDFMHKPDKAVKTINTWVEDKTNDKIKDLIARSAIDRLTTLILTNAIYFKSDWQHQFKESRTQKEDFILLDKTKVKTDMMNQTKSFHYDETPELQILELPYKGQELSMFLFLPKEIDGLKELEKSFSAENLSEWMSKMKPQLVDVTLPKFRTTSEFGLKKVLMSMGMTDAFGSYANFSKIDGTNALYISKVLHKAYVDVDEDGTEAAAATAVIISRTSMPVIPESPKIFRADHPFIFVIRENKTESLLFIGRVLDPTREKDQ